MDPKKLFIDDRFKGVCAYCGASASTRDHVPSRVLLDVPYPKNLPIAESCYECNNNFSIDEAYLACLVECVIHGTTMPNNHFRTKVRKILQNNPSISARIEDGKSLNQDNEAIWKPEWNRVKEIVLKLARGHICYELGLQRADEPIIIDILPKPLMTDDELETFNSLYEDSDLACYPEIGSRAFVNLHTDKPTAYYQWQVIQDGRYRYAVGQSSGDWVKFVLSEYLTCHVVWN